MESILTKSGLERLWNGIKAKFATKDSVYTRDEIETKLTEVAEREHNHDDRYYTKDETDGLYIKKTSSEIPMVFSDGEVLYSGDPSTYSNDIIYHEYGYVNSMDKYIKSFSIDFSSLINAGRKIISYRTYNNIQENDEITWSFDGISRFTCTCTNRDKFGWYTRVYLRILIM